MNASEWVTYSRRSKSGIVYFTRRVDEKMQGHYDTRAATAEEITEELERRCKLAEAQRDTELFDLRPEVKDARTIGSYIELNLERVIEALTPAEWRKFRQALDVHYAYTKPEREQT